LNAVAAAALLGLTACRTTTGVSPQATPAQLESLPPNYRELIAQEIRAQEHFAWGVTEPEITNPGPGSVGYFPSRELTTVCVQYRHPDRFRLATVRRVRVYYVEEGKLVGKDVEKHLLPLQCRPPRSLEPFMEIAPPGQTTVVQRRILYDPANPKGPQRVEEKVFRSPPAQ
jgi:hypothetical protein